VRVKDFNLLIGQGDAALCPMEIIMDLGVSLADTMKSDIPAKGARLRKFTVNTPVIARGQILLGIHYTLMVRSIQVLLRWVINTQKQMESAFFIHTGNAKPAARGRVVAFEVEIRYTPATKGDPIKH